MNFVIEALIQKWNASKCSNFDFLGHFWSKLTVGTISYSIQNYIIRNQIIEKTYSIGPGKTY